MASIRRATRVAEDELLEIDRWALAELDEVIDEGSAGL